MLSAANKTKIKNALMALVGSADGRHDSTAVDALFTAVNEDAAAKGTDLTNTVAQTIQASEGGWRRLPVLGQNGTLTLGVVGAVAGDKILVTRADVSAFTYAVVNGGAGAGTICTFPVSKLASALFQHDGTNWLLKQIGQLA